MKYEYGVEYPTNGKKPDLPYDVVVEIKTDNGHWYNDAGLTEDIVACWFWEDSIAFRIVDERFKPKAETASEFFEKNEPTVYGKPKSENAAEKAQVNIFELLNILNDLDHNETTEFVESQEAEALLKKLREFRPLKTEREKFIDAACQATKDPNRHLSSVFGQLFDAGFRAPEDK